LASQYSNGHGRRVVTAMDITVAERRHGIIRDHHQDVIPIKT
jgi:hypothetical protein